MATDQRIPVTRTNWASVAGLRSSSGRGQLTGGRVLSDQEAVSAAVVGVGVGAHVIEPGPVSEALPVGSGGGATVLPRRDGQINGNPVGAIGAGVAQEPPTWLFSIRPAVSLYPPYACPFRSPVSSMARTASRPPKQSAINCRTSSRTVFHTARYNNRCIASGLACPACSATCQHVLTRGQAAARVNCRAARRGSTCPNRSVEHPSASASTGSPLRCGTRMI